MILIEVNPRPNLIPADQYLFSSGCFISFLYVVTEEIKPILANKVKKLGYFFL